MTKRHIDPLSPEAQAEFGQALEDVFSSVLKRAEEERQQTEPWKNLFSASEQGLRGILSESRNQMGTIAMNTIGVIKAKFGIDCSNKLFYLIMALPYAMHKLGDAIRDQQGNSCCVDKAREVYYQEVLEEIKRLTEEKANAQKSS
jgi:hypothetical protein